MRSRAFFSRMVWIGVLLFIYSPLVVLVVSSFNASRFSGAWEGFTVRWYQRLFQDRDLARALGNTVVVACVSVVVSTVLGTLAGVVLSRYRTRLQSIHRVLVLLPLVMPDILMGISLLLLFVSLGVRLSLLTVIIGHITFCVSYVAGTVQSRMATFDTHVVEAARDLGATGWRLVVMVYLPLLWPAVLSGALLSLTLSLDDFVITFFTAGPGSSTLPIQIYSMIKFGTPPVINALSTIFVMLTFGLVFLYQRLGKRSIEL